MGNSFDSNPNNVLNSDVLNNDILNSDISNNNISNNKIYIFLLVNSSFFTQSKDLDMESIAAKGQVN